MSSVIFQDVKPGSKIGILVGGLDSTLQVEMTPFTKTLVSIYNSTERHKAQT
jgi:hypothetical protein